MRAKRFGDTFDRSYPMDDGGEIAMGYEVSGTVSNRSVRGAIRATVTVTDAAGAALLSCDSGAIEWRTATG